MEAQLKASEEARKRLEAKLEACDEERRKAVLLILANPPAFPIVHTGISTQQVLEKLFGNVRAALHPQDCEEVHLIQNNPWYVVNFIIHSYSNQIISRESIEARTEHVQSFTKKPVLATLTICEWNSMLGHEQFPVVIEQDNETLIIYVNNLFKTTGNLEGYLQSFADQITSHISNIQTQLSLGLEVDRSPERIRDVCETIFTSPEIVAQYLIDDPQLLDEVISPI